MIPRRASSVRGEPAGGEESADAGARGRDRANFLGLVYINARIRSSVVDELALRPEFSAQVRMPPTVLFAPRGVWRGLLVLTAGLVRYFDGRYPTGPVVASLRLNARGFLPSSFRAEPIEGREGLRAMTRTEQNWAARTRGEFNRDRGSRRLSQAVDARRRLNARRADDAWAKAHPVGPSDPRHAYPTRSHD
jgi:hypothetical protein